MKQNGGIFEMVKGSAYEGTFFLNFMIYFHTFLSISTSLIWTVLIIASLLKFGKPPKPNAFSKIHKLWGRIGMWDMALTCVTGLMLPERFGNPDATLYGNLILKQLGIKSAKIYINPIIRALGISDLLLTFLGGRERWKNRIEKTKQAKGDEVNKGYLKTLRGESVETFKTYTSKINGRQRARLLYAYKYAEDHNLLLLGATHKTKRSVGLFAKFGIDDCADLMPLKHIYRTQILQIGQYIGIPAEILNRTPNPDMVPGVTDKYFSYLELSAQQVDLILLGLENEMPLKEIAAQLGLRADKVMEIQEIVQLTAMQRNPSLAPIMPLS